jgi:hypothetical protein
MASENDNNETVHPSSSNPSPLPSKKRKIEDEGPSSRPRVAVATCGRGKNVSAAQHLIDMQLLHSSPTWRSLYQSLRAREAAVKKSHGDRVRSTREKLEKDRPKIGKVVIRTAAAGRVRGDDDHDGRGRSECPPAAAAGGGGCDVHGRGKNGGIDARVRRREAILSKSLGHRARRQQLAKTSSSSSAAGGGGGGGALARIRTESKVASSWSKSSFGDASGGARKSSFGASVAGAAGARNGGGGSREKNRGNSIHVPLGNGRSMTLPSSASFFAGGGTGKASAGAAAVSSLPRLKEKGTRGAFSSLEEKEKKRRRLQQLGTKSIAAIGTRKR